MLLLLLLLFSPPAQSRRQKKTTPDIRNYGCNGNLLCDYGVVERNQPHFLFGEPRKGAGKGMLSPGALNERELVRNCGVAPGPDLLQAVQNKYGPLIYEYSVTPPPTVSGPTRTVVIIDILLRTRAPMHTNVM